MNVSRRNHDRTLYTAAWKPLGTGIIVAMMFLVYAASIHSGVPPLARDAASITAELEFLKTNVKAETYRSVRLGIPLSSLQDNDGQLTANAESFFLLLARRMQSLKLSAKLTGHSSADIEIAATIARRMMQEMSLEPTQLCISGDGVDPNGSTSLDSTLTITITHLLDTGENEE